MVINETSCSLEMSTLNAGVQSASHPVDAASAAATGTASHPPLQRATSSALKSGGDTRPSESVPAVLVTFDDSYLKTLPGIVRMIQVVCSLICLLFLTSSGSHDSSYLLLPFSGHLRPLLFACVAGFLLSIFMVALRVMQLIHMFPINWNMFDLILYTFMSTLFLVSSSLAAHALKEYKETEENISQWTNQQLIGAIVFGYGCMLAFAATAVISSQKRFHKVRQQIQKFQLSQQSSNSTFVEQIEV